MKRAGQRAPEWRRHSESRISSSRKLEPELAAPSAGDASPSIAGTPSRLAHPASPRHSLRASRSPIADRPFPSRRARSARSLHLEPGVHRRNPLVPSLSQRNATMNVTLNALPADPGAGRFRRYPRRRFESPRSATAANRVRRPTPLSSAWADRDGEAGIHLRRGHGIPRAKATGIRCPHTAAPSFPIPCGTTRVFERADLDRAWDEYCIAIRGQRRERKIRRR